MNGHPTLRSAWNRAADAKIGKVPLLPVLVFAAILVVPGVALADWGGDFAARYPSSTSDNAGCKLCHGPTTTTLNSYGKALFDTGTFPPDFSAVEGSNSDGDPSDFSNIQEINANTQPGWTAGPNNTLYSRSTGAVTATGQSPPSGIGTLDPVVVPNTTILWTPSSLTNNSSAVFEFASTVSGSTFACRLDSGSWAACTTPKDYSGLAAGPHVFDVRASAAGSTDATPATYAWTIDKTPPSTVIGSGPADPTVDPVAVFTFSSPDGGDRYLCWLDESRIPRSTRRRGQHLCSSPLQVSVAPGTHTFRVRAVDPAGNFDPVGADWTWTHQP